MLSEVIGELRARLAGQSFDFYCVKRDTAIFDILLKVYPDEVAVDAARCLPTGLEAVWGETKSRAWTLRCCWDVRRWDVPDWLAVMRDAHGKSTMGDAELVKELEEAIQGVSEPEDLAYDILL